MTRRRAPSLWRMWIAGGRAESGERRAESRGSGIGEPSASARRRTGRDRTREPGNQGTGEPGNQGSESQALQHDGERGEQTAERFSATANGASKQPSASARRRTGRANSRALQRDGERNATEPGNQGTTSRGRRAGGNLPSGFFVVRYGKLRVPLLDEELI
jgi:hypothetical protein